MSDKNYVNERNKLIPEAVACADAAATDPHEWNRIFHARMDALAEKAFKARCPACGHRIKSIRHAR
jgi:hypothetical protein